MMYNQNRAAAVVIGLAATYMMVAPGNVLRNAATALLVAVILGYLMSLED